MLRDQQQKLELAARMRHLWEGSGVTQEHIADYIGLKHRSYQKALQTGGISYEKLRKLAEFHDVEFDWLAKGDRKATPDLLNGNGPASQLDRIERKLDEILERLKRGGGHGEEPPSTGVPRKPGPVPPPATETTRQAPSRPKPRRKSG